MFYQAPSKKGIESLIDNDVFQNGLLWKLLIVDDEACVYDSLKSALEASPFEGRRFECHGSFSVGKAKKVLEQDADFAVIVIDLDIDGPESAPSLISYIRETLENRCSRIILHCKQKASFCKPRLFAQYDINDFKENTRNDEELLPISIYSAIRSYKDLACLNSSRESLLFTRTKLEEIIHASTQLFNARTLDEFTRLLLQQLSLLLVSEKDVDSIGALGLAVTGNARDGWNTVLGVGDIKGSIVQNSGPYRYFKMAYEQQRSFFMDDCFVGFFKAKHDNAMLVYLEGCQPADEKTASLLNIFSVNVSSALENIFLEKEISETQEDLLFRLGGFIETRSKETGNHVKRLAKLSYVLALQLGLKEEEAQLIRKASALHDLGKVVIPDSVLKKPGKLTAEEYDLIKRHSEFGYKVLNNSPRPLLKAAAVIAHQHHERYDGKGYPQGLEGEEIHFYARIVAVIDVFDALMHNRYYKDAWDFSKVMETMEDLRGQHFDPVIYDAFVKILPKALDIVAKHNDENQD